jgi:hypothetical protein
MNKHAQALGRKARGVKKTLTPQEIARRTAQIRAAKRWPNRPHEIEIIPDDRGGFKAKYYIGGFMLLTKRHASADNAAYAAAVAIQTDSPFATCKIKNNEIWQISLPG